MPQSSRRPALDGEIWIEAENNDLDKDFEDIDDPGPTPGEPGYEASQRAGVNLARRRPRRDVEHRSVL
jgi:hypothetical protein